jgi:preprotein translocase subunit SecA
MAGRGVDIKLGGNPAKPEDYEEVKSLGGLFVLGTERHDARRIDNQLRGRSGRQGDPGETQFFVSLEDSLMRIFATDTIKKMMGRFNIAEDEPIENKLITSSLEKAQAKIEGFNFDARKHVLEYDDVLNYQRSIIYGRRRSVLKGHKKEIEEYLDSAILLLEPETGEKVRAKIVETFVSPSEELVESLRRIILQTIDMFWVDHLETMDYLRSSVNLRAYGQRDPLVEYKREGLRLFKDLEASVARQVAEFIIALDVEALQTVKASSVEKSAMEVNESGRTVVQGGTEIGRNDPCPCGAINPSTGKPYKYKQCGLINAPHHKI